MLTLSITIASALATLIVIQALLAAGFVARLRRPPAPSLPNNRCPKAALIICIRGKDPTLLECLYAALNQDYPDYAVHIVIDSRHDPAWPLVKRVVSANRQTPSTVEVLENPLPTCSLKCSSLIQAVSNLDSSYRAIALLDTDTVPHRRWLKDMVSPLAERNVGATTGNRWFAPQPAGFASLARYAWNAAAVVLMYWLDIAWGGSLAIKRSVIEEGHLLAHWRHAYGDDTALNPALRRLGYRLEFVPPALITERGNCGFSRLLDWITRQLLSCRLHHRGWWGVMLHGLVTSLVLGLSLIVLVAGIFGQRWDAIAPLAGALAAYFITMAGLLAWLDKAIANAAGSQSTGRKRKRWSAAWKLLPSLLLAQFVYIIALLSAAFARSIEWRGVHYQIEGPGKILMIDSQPSPINKQHRPAGHHAGVASPQIH